MASNKNNQQKGSGADNSDINRSASSDASDVDWMIMSDLGTKISGFSQPQKATTQSPSKSSPQASTHTSLDDDLEDMEWLQSIGLDAEIERSPNIPNASTETENNVENIDWLIVGDLKQRIDDSEIKARAKTSSDHIPPPATSLQSSLDSLDDGWSNNLGLEELDFSESSDFSDLDDLGFDADDTLDSLGSSSLDSTDNGNEQDLLDFNSFLEDNFDLNDEPNDLGQNPSDDWQPISVAESFSSEDSIDQLDAFTDALTDAFTNDGEVQANQLYESTEDLSELTLEEKFIDQLDQFVDYSDLQVDTQSGLEIFNDSFEMETQISAIANVSPEYESEFDSRAIAEVAEEIYAAEELAEEFVEPRLESEAVQDIFTSAEVIANADDFDSFGNGFSEMQDVNSSDAATIGDEVWSSPVNVAASQSYDDAFASDWEADVQNIADSLEDIDISDDSIWGGGTVALISVPDSEQSLATDDLNVNDLGNWQESMEAESAADYYTDELDSGSYTPEWEQVGNEVADSLEPSEYFEENVAVVSAEPDSFENENFDFQEDLDAIQLDPQDADGWAIAEESLDEAGLVDDFIQEEFTGAYENLGEPIVEELEASQSVQIPVDNLVDNYDQDFDQDFAAAIADQITGSGFGNDLDGYLPSPVASELSPALADNLNESQINELENILDDNFDLETFDDRSLIEDPLASHNNIATTLTPVRSSHDDYDQQQSFSSGSELDEFSLEDQFEAELGIEESLVNDLLNGGGLSADISPDFNSHIVPPSFDTGASVTSFPVPPVESSYESKDHDFLDEFDFDSIGTAFDGDEFDSDFANPVISTGLTPPTLPTPVLSPTLPSLNNNPPPPPPFMLPLPPMRGNAQPKPQQPLPSRLPTSPSQVSGSSASQGDRNFDSFHNSQLDPHKFRSNKSISSVDEGWSDLLDADTVLSDALPSPTDSRSGNSSQMGSLPPRPMPNLDNSSQGRSRGNSAPSLTRKPPRLPDFEDLGLEVHDDNNDWSGLLEGADLSDNITTISNSTTPLSSRGQQPIARRSDLTSISETREIPRDRRPQMSSFGDANQARMSSSSNQIDFNRFTEDGYEVSKPPESVPSKPKVSMPSISIEVLWQNYLKYPAIGLGAIGAAFLLYTVMNRPVFELGLRWGIFKDARGLDFTGADLRGAKLDNVDFSKAILTKAKMQDASLEGANFQDANLDGVSFAKANLNQAKLVNASVVWSEFRDAQMRFVDFSGADLTRSNFSGANLNGASFRGTKIGAQGTDKATKLPPINLLAWQIVNQPLEGRNLAGKNLSSLNLSFSNLKRANLTRARLNFTDLAEADLSGANLTGGQLDGANLNGAKLNGINLTGVKFDKSKLPKTDQQTICPDGKNGPCKF